MVGTTNPPQPPTSCATECRVNDLLDTHLKEGEGKEGVWSRKKGGKEEFRGGEGKVEAMDRQEPGRHPPPPPPADMHMMPIRSESNQIKHHKTKDLNVRRSRSTRPARAS